MSDDDREVRYVFTFRRVPDMVELECHLARHAPDATIRVGGGLQVLIEDPHAAFFFALVWRGRYDASYHPHDRSSSSPFG